MKSLIKPIRLITGTAALLIISSCTTNKLLIADFERDTVGNLPALDLLGEPSGDLMSCIACDSGDYRVVEKTTGTPPETNTSKWLEIFGNVRMPSQPRIAIFVPNQSTLEDPVYTISWKGNIVHPGRSGSPFSMSFYSGTATGSQGYFALVFKKEEHRGQEVSSVYLTDIGLSDESSELIGRVRPDSPHSMGIFISSEERTFTITGTGLPRNIVRPIPSGITNIREPNIWMGFVEVGIGVYQLDNLQIIEGKRTED